MKKLIKFALIMGALNLVLGTNLRLSIVVDVIKPSQEIPHHFDYHYQDNNNKLIFRHSHNNNVNHYHTTERGFQDLTVTGRASNIAPSATHIISPEITGPKVQVNTDVHHQPKVISQPTLLGYKQQVQTISSYDPFTGHIVHRNVVLNTPDIGISHQIQQTVTSKQDLYDLKSGKKIEKANEKSLHGLN